MALPASTNAVGLWRQAIKDDGIAGAVPLKTVYALEKALGRFPARTRRDQAPFASSSCQEVADCHCQWQAAESISRPF